MEESEEQELDVDEFLPFVGEFSRFQIIVEVLLCIAIIPQTLQILIMYFAAQNSPWRCASNSSYCPFPSNQSFTSGHKLYKFRCNIRRSEWEFVQPKEYSIITQFDLYCDTEVLAYLTTSLYFLGWAVGAVILGMVADRFGRLKVLFPSLAILIVVGFLSSFSPNFWVFLLSRIIVGFFTPGTGVQMFIMASEFAGEKYRPLSGILLWAFFTVALIMLGLQAYFIRAWKTLFIVCTAPYIFTLAFAKFIPESIRWLNLNGRQQDAMKILRRMARMNERELPIGLKLKKQRSEENATASLKNLFFPKEMAFRTLIQCFAWAVLGLVYFGVALAADDLGGEMYRDYILASLIEFPSDLLAIFFCQRLGRRRTVIPALGTASIACTLVAFIPKDKGSSLVILRVIIGMIGKSGVTIAFDCIYTWSVELHPTIIRAQGIGVLQISSRIGAAAAPWVAKGLQSVHKVAPFLAMGISSSVAVCLLFYLPETKGSKTAETLNDSKDISNEYNVCYHEYTGRKDAMVNLVRSASNSNE